MSEYVITDFVTVAAGEPFRLLPFGQIVKNGRKREITREVAARFRLPHFRPPIKLGSHKDETPAGGHIVALEVRDDGLYAVPEYNDEGAAALARGAFRYHSPEIVWEGGLEDPQTGDVQDGPLIIGDALLHTPHLGEAAALYTADITQGEQKMNEGTVTVPVSWLDRLFGRVPEEPTPPAPVATVDTDRLTAVESERDDLAATIARMESEAAQAERVQRFAAELAETSLADDDGLPGLLAGLSDEMAGELMRRFKALAEQARVSALTANVGHEGQAPSGDPVMELDAAIKSVMAAEKMDYVQAMARVRATQPDLIAAAYR